MTHKRLLKWIIWIVTYISFIVLCFLIILNTRDNTNPQSLPYGYQPWIFGTSKPSGEFEEKITLPVNSEVDILSKREYAGAVSIIIRGEGHLDSAYFHDAFYAYESANRTKHALNSLYIDNREYPSEFFVERPPYSSNHEYAIIYPVGEKFRPIHFRIANGNNKDKSQFTIVVSVRNIVGGDGR